MSTATTQDEVRQQAGKILALTAGYVGLKTVQIGLEAGLFEEIAKNGEGITPDDLAQHLGYDRLYVQVWCRAAYAAEVLETGAGGSYRLANHMETLLLNQDSPGYVGGLPKVFVQPEMFDTLHKNLASGQRIWWDQTSAEWIDGVSGTGRAFYNRLIPNGLSQVPGLAEATVKGSRIADLSCGVGVGLGLMAKHYPDSTLVGVDGDHYSLQLAQERLASEAAQDRVTLIESALEDLDILEDYDVAVNNISMHECRDIEKATANIYRALKPGGFFVISDFPFPETIDGLRTVPARIMTGIQFFEATIDDQLLPVKTYVELLNRHGFRNVGTIDITPVHALAYGQK